ncbi:MAG: helix-turn-helix domain-containing protein [Clostridia bacterium]|nr:helix-turn-helix domain-containing protein [Clostridia bacterium]
MKTAKTQTLQRRVSAKSNVGKDVSRFIHEDTFSGCARDAFYVQAAAAHSPRTDSHLIREPDAADFSYIYDFAYIYSGKGTIECDGKKTPIEAGNVYIINRLHPHSYYPDPDDPYASYWIHVAGTLMNSFFAMLGITEGVLVAHGEEYFDTFEEMNRILLHIKLGEPRQEGYEKIAAMLFGMVLAATADKRRNDYSNAMERRLLKQEWTFVEFAKDYCDRNIALDISIQRLADKVNYSGSHLSKSFMKEYGMPLMDYVMQQKIGYAKEILETSDAPVALIAEALSFSNVQHFSNCFSKAVGCSPSVYRKNHSRIMSVRDPNGLLY